MKYTVESDKIIIEDTSDFNAKHILECGQVFRFKKYDNYYRVYALDKFADVFTLDNGNVIIETSDPNFFVNYFDLNTNYDIIKQHLRKNDIMKSAIDYGYGIRILRQNNIEAAFSFIISANNNIARIQKIINSICEHLGEKCDGYYAFPSVQKLASAGEMFYASIGAGYRAAYLDKTAKLINSGFDMEVINSMSTESAVNYLIKLAGVGPKVADCILLYGYHRTDVFPVDTWIKKVYSSYFDSGATNPNQIRKNLVSSFTDMSGYAQQYLFYYKRELDRKGD